MLCLESTSVFFCHLHCIPLIPFSLHSEPFSSLGFNQLSFPFLLPFTMFFQFHVAFLFYVYISKQQVRYMLSSFFVTTSTLVAFSLQFLLSHLLPLPFFLPFMGFSLFPPYFLLSSFLLFLTLKFIFLNLQHPLANFLSLLFLL